MRSPEIILGRFEDRRHLTPVAALVTPKSVGRKPVAFAPHPALVSGGWYDGPDQEVLAPGRYVVRRPADKTAGAALLWTFFFGPLGLCYLSTGAGIAATGLTAGILVLTGSAVALAVIWPVVMLLSLLYASGR